jgi:hypothetical protein
MSFIENIVGTITNLKNEMKKIAEHPMIEEAVMIIGVYGILTAIAAYILSNKITYIIPGFDNTSSMRSLMILSSIVVALIVPIIIWLIGTGVIHLLSMAAGGEGKFYPQMLTVVGFSLLPMILNGIISIGIYSMIEPQVINISPSNPMAMKELYSSPSFIALALIGIIIQLWSTTILYFGIRNAHKISSASSAIIAAIPFVLSVISTAWSFRGIGIL